MSDWSKTGHLPRRHKGTKAWKHRISALGKSIWRHWPRKRTTVGDEPPFAIAFLGKLAFVIVLVLCWKVTVWIWPFMNSLLRLMLAIGAALMAEHLLKMPATKK